MTTATSTASASWPKSSRASRRSSRPCPSSVSSPVRRPATAARRTGLLTELGQGLDDLLLAFDDFGQEADAVDVAVVIPSGLQQDAGLLLGLDGEAVHRLGEQLAIELADLLGRVLDRVHSGVALDAVMVRHVAEALVEFLLELQHRRDRRVGRKAQDRKSVV